MISTKSRHKEAPALRILACATLVLVLTTACGVAPSPTGAPTATTTREATGTATITEEIAFQTWTPTSNGVEAKATILDGPMREAGIALTCHPDLRYSSVFILFLGVGTVSDVDEIHVVRRSKGEMGRWEKMGWRYRTGGGDLLLWQIPATAFISSLLEVNEFAILITLEAGLPISASFSVGGLQVALGSDEVPWRCSPN